MVTIITSLHPKLEPIIPFAHYLGTAF